MLPGQPSKTLMRSVIVRAAHQLLDRPLILNDPIAIGLVPEASEEAILAAVNEHRAPAAGLYRSLLILRGRFAEDRLSAASLRGVRQYVMLGAGLETFPWRQPDFARQMRIFFSDHPPTLAWTLERFRERGLSPPANLTFVPADLEERRIDQRLAAAGFDLKAPAFVSMLGVTQYLTSETIDSLLAFFASLPRGSEAVFSFAVPDEALVDDDVDEVRAVIARSEGIGEPWLTRVPAADMVAWARRFGFSAIKHLIPELAQHRYFTGRRDQLRAPRREQLIVATV